MPLVINSLRRGHTHTDDLHRINFKKPGVHQPGLKIVPIMANSMLVDNLLPLLFSHPIGTLLLHLLPRIFYIMQNGGIILKTRIKFNQFFFFFNIF